MHLVPLAGVTADADVAGEVAAVLGVSQRNPDPVGGIVGTLGTSPVLLVPDNCEHVVPATRRRAMHAVVEWSWNLLDPAGQAAMRALPGCSRRVVFMRQASGSAGSARFHDGFTATDGGGPSGSRTRCRRLCRPPHVRRDMGRCDMKKKREIHQ